MTGASRAEEQARADLLRGVLDLALGVARVDAAHDPTTVPSELRSVVRHAKIVPRARAAADRAGVDVAFRARIAEAVDPVELAPAERLWLERPDGWEADLADLVAARVAEADEGDARRSLAREQRARRLAEEARDRAQAEVERLRVDLADARAALLSSRDAAEGAADRAERAEGDRADAVRRLKDLEAAHARLHEQRREERAAAAPPTPPASLPDASPPPPPPDDGAAVAEDGTDGAGAPDAVSLPSSDGVDTTGSSPAPAVDPAVARAVAGAAAAAASLADSLAEVAGLLGPEPAEVDARAPTPGPDRRSRPSERRRRPSDRRRTGRRPARLPGGVHDDSEQAAAHLVRLRGAALLVDGYNASMATWPDHSISEQRQRLVSALDGLEARVGIDTTVVFDGVEAAAGSAPGAGRVRVAFTDAEVEADDLILELVDLLPVHRPVVVATDDRRVQDGARRRGANVIGIPQLRALLG